MLGARKTAISYEKFFQWKQDIESDLSRYSSNEGQIHFAFDYGIEHIARLYDIFGFQYGWNKLHVTLSKISRAIDIFETNTSAYKGEDGQKKLARFAHISHPGVLYYIRDELEGYSQDDFRWSEDVLTEREQEKIKQAMQVLSIESGVDIFGSAFTVQRELFNLIQQYGREEIVAFLENAGELGMRFMPQNEGFSSLLIVSTRQFEEFKTSAKRLSPAPYIASYKIFIFLFLIFFSFLCHFFKF